MNCIVSEWEKDRRESVVEVEIGPRVETRGWHPACSLTLESSVRVSMSTDCGESSIVFFLLYYIRALHPLLHFYSSRSKSLTRSKKRILPFPYWDIFYRYKEHYLHFHFDKFISSEIFLHFILWIIK